MDFLELKRIVEKSIDELYENDYDLFEYDTFDKCISERCLTYRLGYYLQNNFRNYKVDSEYNRCLSEVKVLDDKRIFPDLIIHKRKTHDNNLLWIEVKKQDDIIEEDIERVKKITSDTVYHYCYGLVLVLKQDGYMCRYYSNGDIL